MAEGQQAPASLPGRRRHEAGWGAYSLLAQPPTHLGQAAPPTASIFREERRSCCRSMCSCRPSHTVGTPCTRSEAGGGQPGRHRQARRHVHREGTRQSEGTGPAVTAIGGVVCWSEQSGWPGGCCRRRCTLPAHRRVCHALLLHKLVSAGAVQKRPCMRHSGTQRYGRQAGPGAASWQGGGTGPPAAPASERPPPPLDPMLAITAR